MFNMGSFFLQEQTLFEPQNYLNHKTQTITEKYEHSKNKLKNEFET